MTLLASLILTPSCTGLGSGDFCLTARPILVSDGDTLTTETARGILIHNMTGARLCGWKPSEARGG